MAVKEDIEFGWFIPVRGDSRYIGTSPEREPTIDYLTQVAQGAEEAGFTFALIPTGRACIDSWIIGSTIAAKTKSLSPLLAMRPGLITPVTAARMGASLDMVSGGRVRFNVVTGHLAQDLKETGDPLYHDKPARYERTKEFLEIVRTLWTNAKGRGYSEFTIGQESEADPLDYKGNHFQLEGAVSYPVPFQKPHPPIYFGGSSVEGKRTAAETADTYLMWAEPLHGIKEQITEMETYLTEAANQHGEKRTLKYGMRAHVLVRETEAEAWKDAWAIISKVDKETIEKANEKFATYDTVGQQRQNKFKEAAEVNDYVVAPNLWAGLSLVRSGGSLLFVGTPDQVSDRFIEYIDIGISSFILSGYPHLEEAKITGDLLLPLIKEKLAQRVSSF